MMGRPEDKYRGYVRNEHDQLLHHLQTLSLYINGAQTCSEHKPTTRLISFKIAFGLNTHEPDASLGVLDIVKLINVI